MQPQVSPTPYDIVPIPSFAFVPPFWYWLILVLFAVFAWAIIKIIQQRRSKPGAMTPALKLTLKELLLIKKSVGTKETLDQAQASRVSGLLRHFLSTSYKKNFSALSDHELEDLCQAIADPNLKQVIEKIIELDQLRFAPQGSYSVSSGVLNQIESLLKNYQVRDSTA